MIPLGDETSGSFEGSWFGRFDMESSHWPDWYCSILAFLAVLHPAYHRRCFDGRVTGHRIINHMTTSLHISAICLHMYRPYPSAAHSSHWLPGFGSHIDDLVTFPPIWDLPNKMASIQVVWWLCAPTSKLERSGEIRKWLLLISMAFPPGLPSWKRRFLLETIIFRCYVSFRCNHFRFFNGFHQPAHHIKCSLHSTVHDQLDLRRFIFVHLSNIFETFISP